MNPISPRGPRCLLSRVFLGTGHWGHSFTASHLHALYARYALRPLGAAARPLPARAPARALVIRAPHATHRVYCAQQFDARGTRKKIAFKKQKLMKDHTGAP